jgi:O-antigen/teichoic acid export membrane protein
LSNSATVPTLSAPNLVQRERLSGRSVAPDLAEGPQPAVETVGAADRSQSAAAPRGQVTHAAVWVTLGYGGSQVLRLAGNILLSHLLFPAAFGLMALVMVMLQGLEMFSDVGIGPSIIQNRRGDERTFLNTAWTLQVARGFVLWLGSILLAWPAAWFYEQPQFLWLIPTAGLTAALAGFNSTAIFSAKRHLQLKRLTVFDLSTQAVGLAVTCLWAWVNPSLLALVAGTLVASTARMIGSHFLMPGTKNRFAWDAEATEGLFRFGKWIFVSSLITFLAMQADRLVLGKLVPSGILGIYNVGASFSVLPQMLLMTICSSLLYPILSQHSRGSHTQMVAVLRPAREALLAAGVALLLGMFVEADLFFGLLYDDRYQLAAPISRFMTGAIWVTILGVSLEPVFHSIGDSRSTAFASLARFAGTMIASIAGFYVSGLWGFIAGLMVGGACGYLVLSLCLRRHSIGVLKQDLANSALIVALLVSVQLCQLLPPIAALIVPQVILLTTAAWAALKLSRLARLKTAPDYELLGESEILAESAV